MIGQATTGSGAIAATEPGGSVVMSPRLADGRVPDANTDAQVANDVSNALATLIEGILGDTDDDGFFDFRLGAYHNLMCMRKAVKYR